ncbi:conserved hypothetical protein [Caldicellulosiruptor hydrothermalis 108]|uniref:Uncharacterized protein n=1 Tax=Caldicellulosiruptor hydrothermalis (strain DSM 18901 / VKM B-2411 / 108) TaxID=632292 RepID=E4QC01_CALH1|nr:hypothetical protein [Caldicellulosiruptor hydrothermalis]ADQ06175.1 conserved hypothetical protein [Caldicellulosiruptor hydrothermalis 108]
MAKFVNCTPHAINIQTEQGIVTIPPSGISIRIESQQTQIGEINGIPVVRTVYTGLNLPEPEPDTVYIVSTVVLQAAREMGIQRNDLVAPDTGPQSAVRDGTGQIVAVRRFQVL